MYLHHPSPFQVSALCLLVPLDLEDFEAGDNPAVNVEQGRVTGQSNQEENVGSSFSEYIFSYRFITTTFSTSRLNSIEMAMAETNQYQKYRQHTSKYPSTPFFLDLFSLPHFNISAFLQQTGDF